MADKKTSAKPKPDKQLQEKRAKVSQSEFPRYSLSQVLRIPQALWDEFAGKDAAPHDVALALDLTPTSGGWRLLCGAAQAYGLTEGGYNATRMSLASLGRRIVAPLEEADDEKARMEAVLQPRVMREFFEKYNKGKFPSDKIAANVLVELGLPKDRTEKAIEILKANGEETGILRETKTGFFVALDVPLVPRKAKADDTKPETSQGSGEVTPPKIQPSAPTDISDSGGPVRSIGPQQPLARGRVVDCYKLRQRLGAGFSAEVWSASVQKAPPGVELARGDSVAIKFYHAHAMALPDQVLRVEREYRIAQTLRHPNLIRIYEFMLASPRPHHNFLVMDVAKGNPLSDLIERRELSVSQALSVFYQILSALDALHGAGALHRDVKPGNIAVSAVDDKVQATLLDLGIVTISYEKGVTAVSHFLGSKHWAPIEQLLGESLDERSDLYGAAAVAYNALTGVEPYAGSATEAAVAVAMGNGALQLPPLAEVPNDVRDMINACLSYRRNERPNSARDCLDVLGRYLTKSDVKAAQ